MIKVRSKLKLCSCKLFTRVLFQLIFRLTSADIPKLKITEKLCKNYFNYERTLIRSILKAMQKGRAEKFAVDLKTKQQCIENYHVPFGF